MDQATNDQVAPLSLLPIDISREVIETAVKLHRVVIIQAETGAGKSTRVPQYLLSCAKRVIVTQPRRIAASAVARRVAEEMGVELGTVVGYRTATEKRTTDMTRIIFCTDGLEVMRQLFEDEAYDDTIVVIDEAHEWSLNLELLIAWFRMKMSQGLDLKLVIMSATIEAELLSTYFDDADIISSKGRTFPIKEIPLKGSIVSATRMLLGRGHNVLVFQPGRSEIGRLIRALKSQGVDAEIFPLHAGLSEAQQLLCFDMYSRPKCIVATNVAQTSLTVPGINAVVDSGMERRPEIVDDVEGLYLRPISLADREQRKGRAGRTEEGLFIDCCEAPIGERKMFPRAAILTRGLEGFVLQLAAAGRKPEDLKFFHKPPQEHLDLAKKTLIAMKCLDSEGNITRIGSLTASIPIGTRFARMVVETYKHHRVESSILAMGVLLGEESIRTGKSDAWKEYAPTYPPGGMSDAYIELAAFEAAHRISPIRLEEFGIDPDVFERVWEELKRVIRSLKARGIDVYHSQKTSFQKAIVAGLPDQLYKKSLGSDGYVRISGTGTIRYLPEDSSVRGSEWVVGIPWNFQINGEFGPTTKRILKAATAVHPRLLGYKDA